MRVRSLQPVVDTQDSEEKCGESVTEGRKNSRYENKKRIRLRRKGRERKI